MNTIETNKRIACDWLELVSRGDVEGVCRMVAPTWTMVGGPPNLPSGPEGIRALFATFGAIDQRWTIDDLIGEGDRVVVRATNVVRQEHFFGIDARGREQRFTATFVFRIADGQIQQTWRNADDLGRVLQLGARLLPSGSPP